MDDMQKFWENMKAPDWRVVYGEVDLSSFTPEQQEALKNGRDRGFPYQLYANKDWTVSEMVDYREILAKSALVGWTQGKNPVEAIREAYEQEAATPGYKNRFNFENHPDLVCYVPENWDAQTDGKGWTGNDFLRLCGGNAEKAARVFDGCDWQSPETELEQVEMEEADEMELNNPTPEKQVGITSPDSIRPEVISAIMDRLQKVDDAAEKVKGKNLDFGDPLYSKWNAEEDKLLALLTGVNAALGTRAGYCTHYYSGATVDFPDEQGNTMFSIDRHGIVGREEAEKFIFDDDLQVNDDACSLVDGYLWATEPLVTRLKDQLNLTPEQKDSMDNINFYALYASTTKEIRVDGTYYLPGSEEGSPEVQHEFTLDLSPDERKDLISKMEAYCQKENGTDLEAFVNSIRQSEGLPPLGKPGLSSLIQNAESRKEQTPPTGAPPTRSDPTRS